MPVRATAPPIPARNSAPMWVGITLGIVAIVFLLMSVVLFTQKNTAQNNLNTAKASITSTQTMLNGAKQSLASVQNNLNTTKQTLTSTQNSLATAQKCVDAVFNQGISWTQTVNVCQAARFTGQ